MAFENDLAFLRAALPELQDYILSKDIYRPLGQPMRMPDSVQIPQLTIGNLLLSQARLAAQSSAAQYGAAEQPAEQAEVSQRIDQERSAWRANWAQKAAREYTSRLNIWNQYLRELRADPRAYAASYPTEVRHRTILRLLVTELLDGIPQNEVDQLNLLDGILSGLTQPGSFVWEPGVESAFPTDGFWFLYVSIRK